MGFLEVIRFLEGYLVIRVDGLFTERFINICTRRNLEIWDIQKLGTDRISASVSINSFKKLRPVCKRTKTRAKIISRHGLPFFLKRISHRKLAIFGMILVLLALWYLSGHIMGITVLGNQRIPTETILNHLNDLGISLGKSNNNIDSDIIRNQLMQDIDDLAWVGINVSGSRIYIEVVERIEKEKGIEKEDFCHLVANRDGVVEVIKARNGQTMVTVGSGVCQGDILVSGIMDSPVNGFRYVHAYGEVIAKTQYKKEREYPLNYIEETPTGNKKTKYTLKFLDKTLPLYINDKSPYENSFIEEEAREFRGFFDIFPSLFINKKTYKEKVFENKTRTPQEALATGVKELEKELKDEIGNRELLDMEVENTLTERNSLIVSVTLICRENIAEEMPINMENAD